MAGQNINLQRDDYNRGMQMTCLRSKYIGAVSVDCDELGIAHVDSDGRSVQVTWSDKDESSDATIIPLIEFKAHCERFGIR